MPPQPARRNAELVRTATTTATATRHRNRTPRNPLTAIPFAVAAAAVAVGAALHTIPTALAVPVAVATAIAVDVAVTRRLAPQDRGSAHLAVVATAGIVIATATAPLSLRFVLVVTAIAAAASSRIGRHPAVRRRKRTLDLADGWPRIAATVGHPELALNGPVVDRGAEGYTYRVMVPEGQTIEFLSRLAGSLASALNLRVDQVQVELDPDWNRLGAIHIREADPRDSATTAMVDAAVATVTDSIPIGLYADGKPFNLQMFVEGLGGVDGMAAGDKGAGKSSLVIRILKAWRNTPDVAILFADGANGRDFGPWKDCFFRYTTEPREFLEWLRRLNRIADNREKANGENKRRVWRPSPTDPVVALFVEEMAKFGKSAYGPDIAQELGRLAVRNRAIGLIIFGLTQYPIGMNALGPEVRRGMHNRFQFRDAESGTMILSSLPPRQIRASENGTFYAETRDENRRMTAQVLWTPDDERDKIIAGWSGNANATFETEWAAADPPAGPAGNSRRPQPEPDTDAGSEQLFASGPDDTPTVEGQVLAVVPTEFPQIRDLPDRRPEMAFDEADWEFRALLREHGQVTSKQVEQAVGWRRGRVRRELIAPAIDAGWLTPEEDNRGDRVYRPVDEWLNAERRANR
ncbi:hypothetical protein FDG2_0432 [Candidatus Protofrankia californiensis]|uniref:FtsK domain-containing protein n=1 Tax=Candidatus Protofrankia californiensis TaxID=1839754 RepID=A0A1C3NTP0_9ACTN|nr:hypothetical protein FDG2_0432 [Candidatus Protofrankia californiensis]